MWKPNIIILKEKCLFTLFSLIFLPAQVPDNDEQFVPDFQSENCKCDLFFILLWLYKITAYILQSDSNLMISCENLPNAARVCDMLSFAAVVSVNKQRERARAACVL